MIQRLVFVLGLAVATQAQSASPSLVRDVEAVRANCGVGNYLFRELLGKCSNFPELTAQHSDEIELSQSSALANDEFPMMLPEETASWEDQSVFFKPGSSQLSAGEKSKIGHLAEWLRTEAQIRVEIQGFADAKNEQTVAARLSQARASQVASALKGAGIPARQISIRDAQADLDASIEGERRILIRAESL